MHVISSEWIHRYASDAGGWNRKQLEAIGVSWPPSSGWIARLAGKELSDQRKVLFESLRGQNQTRSDAKRQKKKRMEDRIELLEAALRFITRKPEFRDHDIYDADSEVTELLASFYSSNGGRPQ